MFHAPSRTLITKSTVDALGTAVVALYPALPDSRQLFWPPPAPNRTSSPLPSIPNATELFHTSEVGVKLIRPPQYLAVDALGVPEFGSAKRWSGVVLIDAETDNVLAVSAGMLNVVVIDGYITTCENPLVATAKVNPQNIVRFILRKV